MNSRYKKDITNKREAATICPRPPVTLTLDILTLKVVSESRVTWATYILVFLGFSILDLGPIYATDRQIDRRKTSNRQKSDSIIA